MNGISDPDAFLRQLFRVAVDAADPMLSVPRNLPPKPGGRVVILGAGKATARMAELIRWQIDGICTNVPDVALGVLASGGQH